MDELFQSFLAEVEAETKEPEQKRARNEKKAADERQRVAGLLRKAAFQGQLPRVKELLQGLDCVERLLLVDACESDGLTALHLAAMGGHREVCRALLDGRADVDAQSEPLDTPLMWAAQQGHLATCQLLLARGADAAVQNVKGHTAGQQATMSGFRQIKDLMDHHQAADIGADPSTAARRAANLAQVAEAMRQQAEQREEEEFWSQIRARRERRAADGDKDIFKDLLSSTARSYGKAAAEVPVVPANLRKHYSMLELELDATEMQLRKAYRKLALKHHPDKNRDDPEKAQQRFREVALAYEAVGAYLAQVNERYGPDA